jgi:hypothetical protein
VIEDKILTWKNLQKRGWLGPGIYHLCKGKRESGKHLFVYCPFTISVWERIKMALKFSIGWIGPTMKECFENWALQNHNFPTLPAFICWFIWLERNLAIFESRTPSIQKIAYLSLGAVGSHRTKEKVYPTRCSVLAIPKDKIIGWFDGATQRNGDLSGAGGVIKINDHTVYKWTLNCGRGTNTRA